MKKVLLDIAAVILFSILSYSSATERPVVETNYGKVRGHVLKSYYGRDILAFNGIPYAVPPVNHLRFKPPSTPQKYHGILDASKDGEDCFQINLDYNQYKVDALNGSNQYVGDEDCLYLNIYTPRLKGNKLSVLVFIHGGAFKIGSGALELQGPQLLLDSDIILVTINYRLEILGFLRFDDEYLPGNLGLKDQSAALRWIKENIQHFNGDPNSITIFGESAGSASVHLLTLAPQNKDIIKRAISQSGCAHDLWAIQSQERAKELAETLSENLGCQTDPEEMLSCLQGKSVLEIYQAYSKFESDLPHYMDFKPVLENQRPDSFLTKRDFDKGSDIPWIIGVNSGEGIMFLQGWLEDGDRTLSSMDRTYPQLFPKLFYFETCPHSKEVSQQIKEFYFGSRPISMDNAREVCDMFSDAMFNYGFHKAGKTHKGKLYRYLFSHIGERSFSPNLAHLDLGVGHGDELNLLFYSTHFHRDFSLNPQDARVSKQLINLWVNFAKHGDPTPGNSEIKWPESSKSSEYIEITTDGLKVASDLHRDRMDFWENMMNKSNGKQTDKNEL